MKELTPQERVAERIFLIRGHKVMIDRDLAELYGVKTKYLNQQVSRNSRRFPQEFMFVLSKVERDELVAICNRFKTMKHSSVMPHAFTEHGVAMLASVLNSERAIKISLVIIKTFVKLREMVSTHKELVYKLKELEGRIAKHDLDIQTILQAIKQLVAPPQEPKRRIGFHA